MSIFAVNYYYAAEETQLAAVRPVHREWQAEQLAAGTLLAAGPFVNIRAALLIFKADSVEQLAALLDQDPFDIAGFIGERVITEWKPVFGPFAEESQSK